MATIDIVHDAHGNVIGFAEHSTKSGPRVAEGHTLTSLDIPGSLAHDPAAFTTAVHTRLREHLQNAAG